MDLHDRVEALEIRVQELQYMYKDAISENNNLLQHKFKVLEESCYSMIAQHNDLLSKGKGKEIQDPEISSVEEHAFSSAPILQSISWTLIQRMKHQSKGPIGGRNGKIYICYWDEAQLRVVVKLFDTKTGNQEESYLRELSVISQLAHPNIIGTIGSATGHPEGTDSHMRAIVYRYAERGSLQDNIGELDWEQVLKIFQQIGTALDALHQKGLVHRDMKAPNILLNQDYEAKLADFGCTKLDGMDHTDVTAGYTDPQLTEGAPVRPGHDMYGLGITLLQILSGRDRAVIYLEGDKSLTIYQWMLRETSEGRSFLSERLRSTGCNYMMENKMLTLTRSLCKEPMASRPTSSDFTTMLREIENEYMGRKDSEGLNQVHEEYTGRQESEGLNQVRDEFTGRKEPETQKKKGLKKYGIFKKPWKNSKKEKIL